MSDKWIWLPDEVYPEKQKTRYDAFDNVSDGNYTVAEFQKTYKFKRKIKSIHIKFSADTLFQLFLNEKLIATGPVAVGGDFSNKDLPYEWYYATETDIETDAETLDFFARVQMMPVQMCDFSKGHGGFMLTGEIFFEDGTTSYISTDKEWLVRYNGSYVSPGYYDGSIPFDKFVNAEEINDIWHAEISPIPPRDEKEIVAGEIAIEPFEEKETTFPLDMIYAGFAHIKAVSEGEVFAELTFRELNEPDGSKETLKLKGNGSYRGFYLHSAGEISVKLKNNSDKKSYITVSFIITHYPVLTDAETVTSNENLNEILRVCKHTLKYCRQTHHLDSPRHCEPLACTGDYYIESLMTAFSFGDQTLSELDILRTAKLLCHNNGRMFHTTYSLIWVRMLYDTYMFGGNIHMLKDCVKALDMLLARFETYIGENGLAENPPDYMFIDWIYIDGISMHHPPKCLGQTVLNMLYYMALEYAAKIYKILGDKEKSEKCEKSGAKLKNAINKLLYDKEKKLYFEGLNTPSPKESICMYHPQNVSKRYYLKHSNIMAVYTSVCEKDVAGMLIEKIMNGECEGNVQPYFMHYLLEGIFDSGLREKYTLKVIENWVKPTQECTKGLVEGFFAPEPTYKFDHSHAWGGTPLWSLPRALIGLSVDEPALKKITLSPSLLGLEKAKVEFPTPYGTVVCEMQKGCKAKITSPKEIKIVINGEKL